MNDFERDNNWQRGLRDRILAPYFYGKYCVEGRYVFIDKGRMASLFQRRYAVDTIAQGKDGEAICVEEKIVRWPKWDKPHRHFCLETDSCTVPGRESNGWMHYGEADYLLYCFADKEEVALTCYFINFPKLKEWFWPLVETFDVFQMKNTLNKSRGRKVLITDVVEAVSTTAHLVKVRIAA
jgi:hypothetical protein